MEEVTPVVPEETAAVPQPVETVTPPAPVVPEQVHEKELDTVTMKKSTHDEIMRDLKKLKAERKAQDDKAEADRLAKLTEEGKLKELLEAKDKRILEIEAERQATLNETKSARLSAFMATSGMHATAAPVLIDHAEFDERGNITNMKSLLDKATAEFSYLFIQQKQPVPGTTTAAGGTPKDAKPSGMPDTIAAQINAMTDPAVLSRVLGY